MGALFYLVTAHALGGRRRVGLLKIKGTKQVNVHRVCDFVLTRAD